LPGQRSILSALLIMWIFKEEISCSRDWLHILFVTVCSLFMRIVWYIFEHTFFFCLISSMFDHILNIKCHKCQVKSSTALLIADVLQHRSVHLWLIKRVIKVWIETQRDPFFSGSILPLISKSPGRVYYYLSSNLPKAFGPSFSRTSNYMLMWTEIWPFYNCRLQKKNKKNVMVV